MTLFLGYGFIYEPIKGTYLTHRVESANTSAEERSAFLFARKWGRIWEVTFHEPGKEWFDSRELNAAVNDSNRTLKVEIEWLESKPSGAPYRASRMLIEKTNVFLLFRN